MENALTAREVLGLIALAATIIAAIANILVLPGAPVRRFLLVVFFLASIALAYYIVSQRQSVQKLELQIAQRELDERMSSMQRAEDLARQRIEQERRSYESAVDEALVRMRAEFKRQLEERAKTIAVESTKTDQGFQELRQLVEAHDAIQREDVRRFLTGSWQPKRRPPPQGIFNIKTLTPCDQTFAPDASLKTEFGRLGMYDIEEINGDQIFINITQKNFNSTVGESQIKTYFILTLDRRSNEFSIAERGSNQAPQVCRRRS